MSFGILGTHRTLPKLCSDGVSNKVLDKQYATVFINEMIGLEVYGPFDDEDAAISFGKSSQNAKGRWRVVPLKHGYGDDPWPKSQEPSIH